MEIRWHYYIFINCAFLIPCLISKSFNLNEAIAAESQQHKNLMISKPKTLETVAARYSIIATPLKVKRQNRTGIIPIGNKISPLKYRREFQIRSPLKANKVKSTRQTRFRRRNLSRKREANGNKKIDHKYIPLLKSLSMLFDNLLTSGSNESHETKKHKYRAKYTQETNGTICTCIRRSNAEITKSNKEKKTIVIATLPITPTPEFDNENPKTTTSSAYNTALSNIGGIGQNKNISILLARNTSSSWRDDNGFSERSSPTFYRSNKRNFSRNYGDNKYNTNIRYEENETSTNNEENPDDNTRDYPDCNGSNTKLRRNRISAQNTSSRKETNEINESAKNKSITEHFSSGGFKPKRENKLEVGRNETENTTSIPKFVRGFRRFIPENKIDVNTEPIQSKEDYEESLINVTLNSTSHKRFPDRIGTFTSENTKISKTDEGIISTKENLHDSNSLVRNKQNNKVVMIIDGYSVAKLKNGENKVAEKAIHVHS